MTYPSIVPVLKRPRRATLLATTACILLIAGLGGSAVAQAPPPPPPPPAVGAPPPPPAAAPGAPVAGQPVVMGTPVAIARLQSADTIAVKGSVAEVYGNKFIVQDDSGRMLVDLGPAGDYAAVVTKGEQISVQGRFDRGFIAAEMLSHADGRTQAFGPPGPPPPPPLGVGAPPPPPPPPR